MQSKRISSSVASAHAASLQFQYRLFLRELGTLIPETIPLREISRVLDVACGPGSWIVDLAEAHPSMKITGIDKNPEMIRIAQESLSADKARRVTLDVGDILKWLPYSNDYFDFVHLHKASNFIIPQQWPAVVAELLRVLRPGGWINLVGFEPGVTSSPAIDSFVSLVSKALLQAGRSTSPEGSAITAAVLYPN